MLFLFLWVSGNISLVCFFSQQGCQEEEWHRYTGWMRNGTWQGCSLFLLPSPSWIEIPWIGQCWVWGKQSTKHLLTVSPAAGGLRSRNAPSDLWPRSYNSGVYESLSPLCFPFPMQSLLCQWHKDPAQSDSASLSTRWPHVHGMDACHCQGKAGFTESPPRSDISMFRAPGGKDADGQIQLPPLSKSPTPRTCHLISLCGCGPSVRKHFATGCPQWLKSGRAVSEGWPRLLLLTHFSQALASLCQAGKPTKELLWLPEAQIGSSFSVWGGKKIQPLSSGGGGGSLRKPEPWLLSWLWWLALCQMQNYIWTLSTARE